MKALVTHRGHGWHEATVTSRPSGAGSEEVYLVRWRTQRYPCGKCGRELVVADGGSVPWQITLLGPKPVFVSCLCGWGTFPDLTATQVFGEPPRSPGRPSMVGREVSILLPDELLGRLDRAAQVAETSRAAIVRDACEAFLG